MKYEWRKTLKKNIEEQYIQNRNEWYELNFSTNGLVDMTIVSERFANIPYPQRQEQIGELLRESDAPVRLGLHSLYTLSEADSIRISRWSRPVSRADNWLDLADQVINVTEYHKVPQREPRIPHTVTFYSIKGGVGRTTALIHVAWLLALRGRKVVAVDLDVESPGLSSLLDSTPMPERGIVDYFCDIPNIPKDIEPTISITEIFGEVRVPDAPGRLFVVPASPFNLDYMTIVDKLRPSATTAYGENLWSLFLREITEQLQPDIILVDSSTGFNEWGAFSLLRAADQAIVFLSPNEQNKRGINLLLEALADTLPLQLVFSPVPFGDAGIERVTAYWQAFQSNLQEIQDVGTQLDLAKPIIVPYLTELALAQNYPILPLLPNYMPIADVIDENTIAVSLEEPKTTN